MWRVSGAFLCADSGFSYKSWQTALIARTASHILVTTALPYASLVLVMDCTLYTGSSVMRRSKDIGHKSSLRELMASNHFNWRVAAVSTPVIISFCQLIHSSWQQTYCQLIFWPAPSIKVQHCSGLVHDRFTAGAMLLFHTSGHVIKPKCGILMLASKLTSKASDISVRHICMFQVMSNLERVPFTSQHHYPSINLISPGFFWGALLQNTLDNLVLAFCLGCQDNKM